MPVSGETSGNPLQTTPFFPNPVSGMFIKDNSGILNLTHPNHSHNGEILINSGGPTVSAAGRLNNGELTLPITNNGILTIGSTADHGATAATVLTPSQAWRNLHFSTPANTGDAAADADPDHDDVMNLLERAFGGNPNEPDRESLPHTDDTAPLLNVIDQKSTAASDLSFVVRESTKLTTPTWEIATGNSVLLEDNGTIQRIRFTAPAGSAERKFLRVKVKGP